MSGMGGLALQSELSRRGILLPVIVITGHGDLAASRAAFKGGAVDFIEKPVDQAVLLPAVRTAFARDEIRHAREVQQGEFERRLARLSDRERQILDRVVAGQHNREIAAELSISARTVEVYKAKVMDKLGAERLPELIRLVIEHEAGAPPR